MSASILETAARTAAPVARRAPINKSLLAGRVLSGIAMAFLTFDTVFKFVASPEMMAANTAQLGLQPHHLPIIAAIQAICLVFYLIPRTSPVGALLFTGYLGGAILTHFRIDNPLLTHTIFPLYVAAFMWGGLYLRDSRVRSLVAPKAR